MRVGIVTITNGINYGNRLQNYALQETIRKKNIECVETIKNITGCKEEKILKKFLKAMILNIYRNVRCDNKTLNELLKKNKFDIFNKENIKFSESTIEKNNIKGDIDKLYNLFVCGSDQIWNPNFEFNSEIEFLTFADREKRIAYAPSFGVSKIQEKDRKKYKEWISGIKHITVREEAGAKIVKEITGQNVDVVVDPTMFLDKEAWMKVSKEDVNKPKGEYLLTYFLGGIPEEYRNYIEKIAKKNNLEIIELSNRNVPKYYVNGPSEFIDYINSAELFMTDSFHGCVFSMLMETPFVVCKRNGHTVKEDMYSRIDTFVSKFKLEDRQFENIKDKNLFEIDYTESYKILEKEREKSHRFLNNALGIKEKV